MNEKIIELVINCLPALIAGITCIITMFKVIGGLNAWTENNDKSNVAQLERDLKNVVKKSQEMYVSMTKVLEENEELKIELKKTLMLLTAEQNEEEIKEG